MIYMKELEFYITNVCNLTCDKCRAFNNYDFKGHYKFDKEMMLQWSKKVQIGSIEILGGEPTLHPQLWDWVSGIRELWPDSKIEIVTNGTHFKKIKNFHKQLVKYNCNLQVSAHGNHFRKQIAQDVFDVFGECQLVEVGRFKKTPEIVNSLWFKSSAGVYIEIQNGNNLQDICFTDNNFNLHNSDPKVAHGNCNISDCHHMIDNKIYKCSIVGLLPEFLKQQGKTTDCLVEYTPLDVNTITQEAYENLKHAIPQCSICPEGNSYKKTTSNFKKESKSQLIPSKDIL